MILRGSRPDSHSYPSTAVWREVSNFCLQLVGALMIAFQSNSWRRGSDNYFLEFRGGKIKDQVVAFFLLPTLRRDIEFDRQF